MKTICRFEAGGRWASRGVPLTLVTSKGETSPQTLYAPIKLIHIIFLGILFDYPLQFCHLGTCLRCDFFVDVLEQSPQWRPFDLLCFGKFLQNLFTDLRSLFFLHLLVPQALPLHPLSQPNDRVIPSLPFFDFHLRSVGKAVIACAVMADSVAHRFNQYGPPTALKRHLPRFRRCLSNGKNIISIDADSVDSIANSATSDAISLVLLQ